MDERELLLLGLLLDADQHGYQLNEWIEQRLQAVTTLKRPTAYAVLERLCAAGSVSLTTVRQGRRPPRKVYHITPAGRQRFVEGLRRSLADGLRHEAGGQIALLFIDVLPPGEAAHLMRVRHARLLAQIAEQIRDSTPGQPRGLALALEHRLWLLRAEADWLAGLIARLAPG